MFINKNNLFLSKEMFQFDILYKHLVEQRQAFMLTEHFIRSENNLKQLTLYGLLCWASACSEFRACHGAVVN